MTYNDFCISSFLTFRYVVRKDIAWKEGLQPRFPSVNEHEQRAVETPEETLENLTEICRAMVHGRRCGLLLSSGIDSAIIASLLPSSIPAYTIAFRSEHAIDESRLAKIYAESLGLNHRTVSVTWDDYEGTMDLLMRRKQSPLHPIEPGLYMAAKEARQEGIDILIVGNGADSTFGGLDKLLSRDWTGSEFRKRYTFVDPYSVVKNAVAMDEFFEPYNRGKTFDVSGFLKKVHGFGIIRSFEESISAAGCSVIAPYEMLRLKGPLDMQKIRSGESKYILKQIFKKQFSHLEIPPKIPFARPMDDWMRDWEGPKRDEFLKDIRLQEMTGDQKWLLYCLERFMNLFEDVQ